MTQPRKATTTPTNHGKTAADLPRCRECGAGARYVFDAVALCSQHRGLLGKFQPLPAPPLTARKPETLF